MKKITYLLTLVTFMLFGMNVTAQNCDYVEAGIDAGQDDAGAIISVDLSCVPAGNSITNVVLNDFTDHYSSATGTANGHCNWYAWDIIVNGTTESTDVCGADVASFDFSAYAPITSIDFQIVDEDAWSDHVFLDIDATMTYIIGNAPILNVPASPVTADSDAGVCGAIVNYAASAVDIEDGGLTPTQIAPAGLVSGDVFPVGTTNVVFEVTDSDGNIVTEDFDIIVSDVENPVAICQNLTVELDASGSATVAAADLNNGSTDNCSIDTILFPAAGPTTTLAGAFASNNGFNGNMFDVTATNALIINSFDVNLGTGVTDDVAVYYKTGTFVGSETNAADWTLLDTAMGVVSAGSDIPTPLNLSLGLNLGAGETVGFYLTTVNGGNWRYQNGTGGAVVGDPWVSDANLALFQGVGKQYPFNGTYSVRNYTGNIVYNTLVGGGNPTITFDCSNIGSNNVTVEVTDVNGLSSSCSATITVEDNQAPVVLCKGSGGTFSVLEEFESSSMPAGWSTQVIVGAQDWSFGESTYPYNLIPLTSNVAMYNDDATNGDFFNTAILYSPVYNLDGADVASLSFDYTFLVWEVGEVYTAEVFDGTNWVEIFRQDTGMTEVLNTGVIDVQAYANADFQVRFTYEDAGSWGYAAVLDNFVLDYNIPPTPPLEVDLMADGTISIDPADLLVTVSDNCGYTVSGMESALCAISNPSNALENGSAISGAYTSANDFVVGASDITLSQITLNLFHAVGATVPTVDLYYYDDNAGMPGTQIGSQMAVAATSETVIGNNYGFDVSEVVFDITPFTFTSGATYWIAAKGMDSNGGVMFWETTSASASGSETMYFDDATGVWAPQVGMDGVYKFSYDGGCNATFPSIDYDCSNIGENSVDVAVVDNAGNETVCTATVIVSDVTAPALVCGPDPVLYGNGTASDAPGLTIDTDGTDVIISSVINITDDFDVSDINVVLNVTHTYIGDMNITLTSPDGTTVLLFGGLCGASQNLDLVFDDEGLDEGITCGDLQSGQHLDIAAVLGYDPLSTFDGENLMGDWTLTIEDTWPGLDGGMLNSWGIEYEYSYPNPSTDLNIELDATGNYTITPDDMLSSLDEACGIDVILTDVTDVDCSDIGTPILVTVFANDASGNFASCQYEVNVVDAMAPVLNCPGNQNVPSNNNGMYEIPDYFALTTANATDNCTDAASIVLTQTPAPGTLYGITDGTANPPVDVVFTATDAQGNVATCQFVLEIRNGIGVTENSILDSALEMFPNPATQSVTLRNNSEFTIDTAMVYDINGKLVKQIDLQSSMSFDVSKLEVGVYMVKIIGDEASAVKRLIVE